MLRKKLKLTARGDPKQRFVDIRSKNPDFINFEAKVPGLPPDCDFRKIRIYDPENEVWSTEKDFFYCASPFCEKKKFIKKVCFFILIFSIRYHIGFEIYRSRAL